MIEAKKAAGLGIFDHTAYEFYALPFYVDLNRRFIDSLPIHSGQTVVDVGCGTGATSELIAGKVGENGHIIAVDILESVLELAKQKLSNLQTPVDFLRGRAEELADLLREFAGEIDAVVIGNAVHNFEDKAKVFRGIGRLLKPGRLMAFNLTFFDGGIPEEEDQFYKSWIMKALRYAVSELRQSGTSRPRVNDEKQQANNPSQLTQDEYEDLVRDAGLEVKDSRIVAVDMPLEAFTKISQDPDFLNGVMPKFNRDTAIKFLQKSAIELFQKLHELGKDHSTRNWLEVVAVKV